MRISILGIVFRNGHVSHGILHTTRNSKSRISPIAPDAISARAASTAGAYRSWKFTAPRSRRARTVSSSRVASARSRPKGFCMIRCEPTGSADSVWAAAAGGSATSNTPPDAMHASMSSARDANGVAPAMCASLVARAKSRSKMPATWNPALAYAGRCASCTIEPAPITSIGRSAEGNGGGVLGLTSARE